ncbi:MAG: T9SS type A sorting domain-containing protein [Bacteroidetes bacterium]|nr:T9SS type A sorting domain-containing protein [Bacteroidota bacterium]
MDCNNFGSSTISADGPITFCAGNNVTLSCNIQNSNYQWKKNGVNIAGANSQFYKVITKNNINGCSRIGSNGIVTTINCQIFNPSNSIYNFGSQNEQSSEKFMFNQSSPGVNIYPNPCKNSFFIEYDGGESGAVDIKILNSLGQTIYSKQSKIIDGQLKHEIKLSNNISPGIYIVRMLINSGLHDSKVMIE